MFEISTLDKSIIKILIDTVDKIEQYKLKFTTIKEFEKEQIAFDAVLMNFIVIGEMVTKLSSELKNTTKKY